MCIIQEMPTLILLLIISGIMVYLAQNNLMLVTLNLGTYVFTDIPLFYVIISSLLAGLVLSYLVHLINAIFISFNMRSKDNKIKHDESEIVDLTKRIHQLELENEKLKNGSVTPEPFDKNAL